jgi:hypothetical protein
MIKSLEERKEEYLEYIYQEILQSPRGCWQQKNLRYHSLRDFLKKNKYIPNRSEEIIVNFDFKRALLGSALFLCVQVVAIILTDGEKQHMPFGFIAFTAIIAFITLYKCLKEMRYPTRLKMNQQGIWVYTLNDRIKWKNLISCYIKEDQSGEYPDHFLVLHYYAEDLDIFTTTEIGLNGLTLSREGIAAEIFSRK